MPTNEVLRRLGFRRVRGPAESVLFVCSGGGHLQQMIELEPACEGMRTSWVTLHGPDTEYLLRDRDVVYAHGPTNRDVWMLLRNLPLAWRTIRAQDPDTILSTGAGVAVPFFWLGRVLGRRCVYVESLTRLDSESLTAKLVYPFASAIFVQWPEAVLRRKHRYVGSILDQGPV